MNTTNKEIIEEFTKRIERNGLQGVLLARFSDYMNEALNAKDNKHREETREIVEGMPCREMKCCDQDDCPAKTVWSFIRGIESYKDHIKDKYNLN